MHHASAFRAGAFFIPIEPSGLQSVNEGPGSCVPPIKASGVFDGRFAGRLDASCTSGWSTFYNFCMSRNEGPYGHWARSGALRAEEFGRLHDVAEAKILDLARGIIDGCITPQPFRLGTQVACNQCEYAAVCKFDWQINSYRVLSRQSKRAVVGSEVPSNG